MMQKLLNASVPWVIITATREALGPWNSPENAKANKYLGSVMRLAWGSRGVVELTGVYKGVEQGPSFLVFGPSLRTALAMARRWGQESVVVPEGLLFQNGEVNPRVPAEDIFGPEAAQQEFHSVAPNGECFSLGLDFGVTRKIL